MENEQKQQKTGEIVKFRKPFQFDGRTYEELVLDLDSLTGDDLIACERMVQASQDMSYMKETSKSYLAAVAARSAKVPVEMMSKLPAREFTKVTVKVQTFLLG
ncbi:phage tail assembly protein [Brevibacillus brevis]|nr:phage tail assembly protein [Brevibacillus brevis]